MADDTVTAARRDLIAKLSDVMAPDNARDLIDTLISAVRDENDATVVKCPACFAAAPCAADVCEHPLKPR